MKYYTREDFLPFIKLYMKCGVGVPVSFAANMPEIMHEFECSPIYWRKLCEMGYTVPASFSNNDMFTEKFVEEIVLGKLWEDKS